MTPFSDLRGKQVGFRVGDVYHPDQKVVHETWCRGFKLQGTCEEVVASEAEGGPYAVVRIEEGQEAVFVPVARLEDVIWNGKLP